MNPQLAHMSMDKLKVAVYDQLRAKDIAQNNLNILNKEIAEREAADQAQQPVAEEKVGE